LWPLRAPTKLASVNTSPNSASWMLRAGRERSGSDAATPSRSHALAGKNRAGAQRAL
uniref:Copper-containing nitrite reductase n=1 Tax=Brugia timori TaxID=42155 RepID=A0A0R3QB20_9BILA